MTCFQNQRGLTILETIIVLMIAGLIISGIWMAYAGANLNDRVARTAGVVDKTLQVARDYLTSKSLPTSPQTYLSNDLYTQGLMPSELSYKGPNGTTQVFTSPLGYDFFIQNSTTPETINGNTIFDVFEIHISFVGTTGVITAQKTCLALMPKLIGTQTMINERGMIGWIYGGQPSGLPAGNAVQAIGTLTPAQQAAACAAANNAVLYFRYRP